MSLLTSPLSISLVCQVAEGVEIVERVVLDALSSQSERCDLSVLLNQETLELSNTSLTVAPLDLKTAGCTRKFPRGCLPAQGSWRFDNKRNRGQSD